MTARCTSPSNATGLPGRSPVASRAQVSLLASSSLGARLRKHVCSRWRTGMRPCHRAASAGRPWLRRVTRQASQSDRYRDSTPHTGLAAYWEQGRAGAGALLHGVRAAGAEATARRRVNRIRGIPQKRQPVEAFVGIHRGCRGKQGLRVGMQRRCATSSVLPISMICPRYMTRTRSLRYSMTSRSCEMNR